MSEAGDLHIVSNALNLSNDTSFTKTIAALFIVIKKYLYSPLQEVANCGEY